MSMKCVGCPHYIIKYDPSENPSESPATTAVHCEIKIYQAGVASLILMITYDHWPQ